MLPFKSLDAVTSGGSGSAKDLESAVAQHTLHAVETGGQTHSDLDVGLEGSHDGVDWFRLGNVQLGANATATTTVNLHLVRYVRAVLTGGFSGSAVVTATIASGA